MGKATKAAQKAMSKVLASRKAEAEAKEDERRIRKEASRILKKSPTIHLDSFIPADHDHPSISSLTVSKIQELGTRKNVLLDFYYDDGSEPDLGVEGTMMIHQPKGYKTIEVIISHAFDDDDSAIYRGGLNPEKPKQISLACNSPFKGSLRLTLGVLVRGPALVRVLDGRWTEVDQDASHRSGDCRVYLPE